MNYYAIAVSTDTVLQFNQLVGSGFDLFKITFTKITEFPSDPLSHVV
jgi:hypothetical protein